MPDLPASDGRRRVAIEHVRPAVDCGRFAVKRIVGQTLTVTADVFADGHDVVRAVLAWRSSGESQWSEVAMTALVNDAWEASFGLDAIGRYEYTIEGWVDTFATWRRDLVKRIDSGQDISTDLNIGAGLVAAAAKRVARENADRLRQWHELLSAGPARQAEYLARAAELDELMERHADRSLATRLPPLAVVVDPPKARFSTWYELFPRSCSGDPGKHGTLADCIGWLPRLAEMGFDVLYLPPIHPIGITFRKGKNNAPVAEKNDHGCPWAIGSEEGGHLAIHPRLGTVDDLKLLIAAGRELGIEVALDIAFQCSPDHPYVREHSQWFKKRPDGTIQYAENPPKKYQDIYPFDFETPDWPALWRELCDVVLYWCAQGTRVFRVDNPHTKPFEFWEYLIGEVKAQHPEAIFLSEAFTRPKVMYHLAKVGFTQSYTYFTWRTSSAELTEYFTQLADPELREYFRPNLWPNTPDILPEHLQAAPRAAFVGRLVVAATLSANYGIYGPAFEAMETTPREPGSEEYLDSEKYQIRAWDLDRPEYLGDVISAVNRARRENSALQSDHGLEFHPTDNDQLLCYSKHSADRTNWIVVVVNLNFREEQHGHVELPLAEFGIDSARPYRIHDLLGGETYTWQGPKNFVELDPAKTVAHIFRVLPQG